MAREELEEKIKLLEMQLRHLDNDFRVTKEEYEHTTARYLEILSELKSKNAALEELQKYLEVRIKMRTRELEESRQMLQHKSWEQEVMLDSTPALIFYKDLNHRFIRINKAFAEFLGITVKEAMGKTEFELFPDKAEQHIREDLDIVRLGKSRFHAIESISTSTGKRWIQLDKVPFKDSSGKISGIIGFGLDITERREADRLLRERELRFRTLFEEALNPIFILGKKGEFIDANNSAIAFFERPLRDLVGKRFRAFLSKEYARTLEPENDIFSAKTTLEARFTVKRRPKTLLLSIVPSKLSHRTIYYGIGQDITDIKNAEAEKKLLEEQLVQSQKLESIGRLAGGIAHDFNNILTGIMGWAEMLRIKYPETSVREGKAANVIYREAEKAANLTSQLLGFARGGKYRPVPLFVNEVIKDIIIVSEKIFDKKIQVEFNLDKDIFPIEADKHQLEQVFTNIVINARDAMPDGGNLFIKSENMLVTNRLLKKYPELRRGRYIMITIRDSGSGIPGRIIDKIFDPFFTTKAEGKGTGLGLATAYGIVKNHNGHITCSSVQGKGTTFTIYFPATDRAVLEQTADGEIVGGKATILVVDDESEVRSTLTMQLNLLGYEVLEAQDGGEAVSIYRRKKAKIDLVLIDMIMPNLAGKETYRELKSIHPGVRVLFMSGYTEDGQASEILKEGVIGFIQKPFNLKTLSVTVHQSLKKRM